MSSISSTATPDHVYENPAKLIKSIDDMKIWEKSEAYFEYLGFILAINEAVKGVSNSRGSKDCSENILKLVTLLDKLDAKVDETPPIQQPQRFGNQAFRQWYQKLKDDSLILLQEILPPSLFKAVPEIVSYLVESFGNATRIDYGTGHEISFVMFICCLYKIGVLVDSDRMATGCKLFPRYLDLARKLQKTYRMEPAGSHGVWSLDDFQFVPFIWGSSQLFAHPRIEPSGFLQQNILDQYGDDYMFLSCIKYINTVKSGPFAEHSNQLWSISGVSSWGKINGGLIKMYKVEVLSKFPVVQHIVFGSLFTLRAVEEHTGLMSAKTSWVRPPAPHVSDNRSLKSGSSSSDKVPEQKSSLTIYSCGMEPYMEPLLEDQKKTAAKSSIKSGPRESTQESHSSKPPSMTSFPKVSKASSVAGSEHSKPSERSNQIHKMSSAGEAKSPMPSVLSDDSVFAKPSLKTTELGHIKHARASETDSGRHSVRISENESIRASAKSNEEGSARASVKTNEEEEPHRPSVRIAETASEKPPRASDMGRFRPPLPLSEKSHHNQEEKEPNLNI